MTDMQVHFNKVQIAKLRLRPGDVLIVKMPVDGPGIVVERTIATLKQMAPNIPLLVIGNDVDLSVLTRAEIETKVV